MRTRLLPIAAAGILLCASALQAQARAADSIRAADSTRAMAFDRLDRTSRAIIATVNCASASARARAQGQFGPVDSVGRWGQCLYQNGRAFGLFFTPDSTFTRAQNLRVFDFANATRYSGAVDTSAILAEARASGEAVRKGMPAFVTAQRKFVPISLRSDGDSIEVWLLPAGLFVGTVAPSLGGEHGFVYSPDGRTLAREIDASDRFRAFARPDTGQVVIHSSEDNLPLMSEFIVTNLLYDQGRDVQIATRAFTSVLGGPRSSPIWFQLKKR